MQISPVQALGPWTQIKYCEDVFTQKTYRSDRLAALKTGSHHALRARQQIPIRVLSPESYVAWTSETVLVDYLDLKTVITKLERIAVNSGVQMPAFPRENMDVPVEMARANVEYVIATYSARRPHWTPEFLAKLRKVAKDYANESTYITVYDRRDSASAKMVGTLRLIREREGLLPMERYLGIEVDVGNALKVEPGNFAISKEHSADAWPEIMMQLRRTSVVEFEPGRPNHYLTYADKYSKALYGSLGFKPIPLERLKLKPGVVTKDGEIIVDGVAWTPMEASQATLSELLDVHARRLEERGHDLREALEIHGRSKAIDRPIQKTNRFISHLRTVNGRTYRAILELADPNGYAEDGPLDFRVTLHSWPADQAAPGLYYTTETGFAVNGYHLALLDREQLPLREGLQRARRLNRRSRGLSQYEVQLTYNNGLLSVVDPETGAAFDMTASSDLSVIWSLRLRTGDQHEGLEFEF